ncbi:hypothetical protein HYT24_02085 [Candidatus Pacearchaeota archaeon]|nr:hypothetical protein [Candidatus Pacearchaeota archaeon]
MTQEISDKLYMIKGTLAVAKETRTPVPLVVEQSGREVLIAEMLCFGITGDNYEFIAPTREIDGEIFSVTLNLYDLSINSSVDSTNYELNDNGYIERLTAMNPPQKQ